MKVILCKPNEKPQVVDIPKEHTYLDIKRLLNIESPLTCVERRIGGKYFDFWCDDEGLFPKVKYCSGVCRNASEILCGNILIAKHDSGGNLVGLTKQQIDFILDGNNFIDNECFVKWSKNKDLYFEDENGTIIAFDYGGFGKINLVSSGSMYEIRYLKKGGKQYGKERVCNQS